MGAAVVCDRPTTVGALRSAAKNVLSAFKVPTIWLLLDDDDAVARKATGKVDVRALRELLAASSGEQT